MISDEVMDAIAQIELHRQEMEKEAGVAAACNEALRKLHELLEREREALQLHGPGARNAAHIEALAAEIERVKSRAGAGAGAGAKAKHGGPPPRNPVRPGPPHNLPRNKRRRTTGRSRGR
jgi:bacterioferritin-associated ferredoxin